MSGIEAREILFEVPDVRGDLSRRIIWCMVQGPTAVAIVFTVPVEHAPEVEPFFRAVVQSLVVLPEGKFPFFEELRSTVIKESKPVAINEVQELAAAFAGSDNTVRASGIERLASIFSSQPDAAIENIFFAAWWFAEATRHPLRLLCCVHCNHRMEFRQPGRLQRIRGRLAVLASAPRPPGIHRGCAQVHQ